MLTQGENELITRTGPGTLMGDLFRRFWMPALLSRELPSPDCPPVRVLIMNEQLIAYRDTSGAVGLIQDACPHRGASLFFGRNEEEGLRCVYHGWKFDLTGACVDMPNEPAESNFKHKIRATAYPTQEAAGFVWAYMGPPEKRPPFPDYVFNSCPPEHVWAYKNFSWANYLQSLEGGIDSSHIGYLHRSFSQEVPVHDGTEGPGLPSTAMSGYIRAWNKDARLEVQETAYGLRYGAIRQTPAGALNVRVTNQLVPNVTMVAALPWGGRPAWFIVPRTDETCWRFHVMYNPLTPMAPEDRPQGLGWPANHQADGQRAGRPDNDYLIDRAKQKTVNYTGIMPIDDQDFAVVESMGPVLDRTQEHLGTTDVAIIKFRRLLLSAARNLRQGIEPAGTQPGMPYHRIRQGERNIRPVDAWQAIESDDTEWEPILPPVGTLGVRY